jgi:metal-responsive CopG/Arc/MetJ family transcriptional regulator
MYIYMAESTTNLDGQQSEALNVRLSHSMLQRIDEMIRARGLLHRSEAVRQLIAAGLEHTREAS